MVDAASKFVQAVPLKEDTRSSEVTRKFWLHLVCPFGAPGRLTADNDVRWKSDESVFVKMLRSMGTQVHWTTPYRSPSNGRCERHVQELNKMVKVVCATFAPNEEDAEGDEDLLCMACVY